MTELDKAIYNQKRQNYKNTELSLYDRFWAEEKKSEYWLSLYSKAKKSTDLSIRESLIKQLSNNGKNEIDTKKESIDQLIDQFTKSEYSDEYLDSQIKIYNDANVFENGHRSAREAIVFEKNGKKIVVRTLSDACPGLLQYFPELLTKERNFKCHEGSIKLARTLPLENIRVTTGTFFTISPQTMVLHSVAEAEIAGESYVLDYESNTLWEKDDFYQFYNFEPFEIILATTLEKELDDIVYLANIDKDYTKLYLTSRNEALKIVQDLKNQNENK